MSPEGEDESSKQHDDEHHASNQSTTILDEDKNLCCNLYSINGIAVPGGMLHQGAPSLWTNFNLNLS